MRASSKLFKSAATWILCVLAVSAAFAGVLTAVAGAAPQVNRDSAVVSLRAQMLGDQVVVTWETAGSAVAAGFIPQRFDPATGSWTDLVSLLVPARFRAPAGAVYAVADRAPLGSQTRYRLREIEIGGGSCVFGPVSMSATPGALPARLTRSLASGSTWASVASASGRLSETAATANAASQGSAARQAAATNAPSAVTVDPAVSAGTPATSVRIGITAPGLYELTATSIASALGTSASSVSSLIGSNGLMLTNNGQPVSTLKAANNDGLYFYGQGLDTIYSGTNVYWLSPGAAQTMATTSVPVRSTAVTKTFLDNVTFEKSLIAVPSLFHDPEADFWFWDTLVGGGASGDRTYAISTPDVSKGVSLRVTLHGLTATGISGEHHVRVSLNGHLLGDGRWTGATAKNLTFPIPKGALHSGNNSVSVKALLDSGVSYNVVGLESFAVSYVRACKAVAGQLDLTAGKAGPMLVSGLPSATAWVMDITKPGSPQLIRNTTTGGPLGAAWVRFGSATRHGYLVATPASALPPASMTGTIDPGLKAAGRGADYVVITAPSLATAAGELASYRQSKGLSTAVVTTQQIYDEFSYGITTPHSITAFVAYALANWKPAPRFVVLAGDGSFDYRNYLGHGDSLVPSLMADTTTSGLAASDVSLMDTAGNDGVPDVAVGRIPVLTGAQLSANVAKVKRYEASTGAWRSQMLLAADNADSAGDFPSNSEALVPLLPTSLHVQRAYIGPITFAAARTSILNALDKGALLVNYLGHGGVDQLAQSGAGSGAGVLNTSDVAGLAHIDQLPVFAMMTCVAGQFGLPGYQALGEALAADPSGGAIAVLGPSAFEYNFQSVMLDRAFVQALFSTHSPSVGVATRAALAADAQKGGTVTTRRSYALLGDPALVMQW